MLLILVVAAWITVSRNPYAQGVRAIFGRTPDRSIIDHAFTVGPHGFRFYKFSLPDGSAHMAVVGQFSVSSDSADNAVEVLVLSEDQFDVWQTGAPAHAVYESGRISHGDVHSDLPAGSTAYFLVLSNKASTAESKKVTANFVLRHRNWWR
ncbi:MAG: hypothetical protein ACRD3B_15145 [Candidatus Sulfotelmatobacter sp.]